MRKIFKVSMALLLTVSCSAQWGKTIKGNKDNVTLTRSVGEYDGVALSGWFDVELTSGKEGELVIKGESNLLEYVVTEVKNGTLTLGVKKGYNLKPSKWDNGIHITVPITQIDMVKLSGSGDIIGSTTLASQNFETKMSGSGDITLQVDAKNVKTSLSGSGDITLSGAAENLEVNISGSGDVNAYDLKAKNVDANITGSADIEVTATKMLKARVTGSGDISYRGNPAKVDTKTSGSGDITKD